jgi:hypothetical protein
MGGTWWHLHNCSQYILISFTPPPFFIHSSLLLRITLIGFIVLFAYTNTKYFHHIHLSLCFPYALPSHSYPPLDKTCFTFLSFIFFKKRHLVSLWQLYRLFHCDISIYACILPKCIHNPGNQKYANELDLKILFDKNVCIECWYVKCMHT